LIVFALVVTGRLLAQQETEAKPLPDIPELMRAVEKQQRAAESTEKEYMFRESTRAEEFDGKGHVKKLVVREYEVFWIEGVNVQRLVKKDGNPLSPDEQKKENERVDKLVAKAKERRENADAKGVETDSQGHEEVTVSRLLELGSFTGARRVTLDGRDTIAVDFTGDPKAKTRNRAESFLRDVAGTVWVDEQDRSIAKLDAHVENDFKIGGGLIADLRKGSTAIYRAQRVNGEVWLPSSIEAHGHARVMLFSGFDGNVEVKFGDYRRFKATSTILPGSPEVAPDQPAPGQDAKQP
jgi:hypothetical protein